MQHAKMRSMSFDGNEVYVRNCLEWLDDLRPIVVEAVGSIFSFKYMCTSIRR